MRRKILLILPFIIFGLFSASSAQAPVQRTLPKNCYKYFTGTIGNIPVTAAICSAGGYIKGNYCYNKYGKYLSLSDIDSNINDDNFVFAENKYSIFQKNFAEWKCHYQNGSLTGVWISKDKKRTYPIRLQEHYPTGVTRFGYRYFDSTFLPYPKIKVLHSPTFKVTLAYPVPLGNNPKMKWLRTRIRKFLGFDTSKNFSSAQKKWLQQQLENYLTSIPSADYIQGESAKQRKQENFQYSWDEKLSCFVGFNKAGYVQWGIDYSGYSGGIHGNYGEFIACYDLKNQKKMTLSDITTMDSVQMQSLLEARFRKINQMKPTDSLSEILFDNHLPPNENFSFDGQGITFTYNPYDVASYSDGQFNVFIPYSELKGTLMPEFKRRMGL